MSDLTSLLHELDALPGCVHTKRSVKALLRSFAGRRLYLAKRDLLRPDQVRLAASMLANGMQRAEVAKALQVRLEVSESTAYRVIQRALDARRPAMTQLGLF